MMTAEQIIEAIHELPKKEKEALRTRLPEILGEPEKASQPPKGAGLLALAGCVDLGECLIPNPDREMIYGDR